MRFHKFETLKDGLVYVDLDAVHAISPSRSTNLWTRIAVPSGFIEVQMGIDDVMALISPPAATDTYEERLADHMDALRKQGGQGPLNEVKAPPNMSKRTTDGLELEPPHVAVDVSAALKQGERRIRLDELERFNKELMEEFPFSTGSWTDKYIKRRRTEIAQGGF